MARNWFRTLTRPALRVAAGIASTFRDLFLAGAGLAAGGFGRKVAGVTVNASTALTLPAYFAVLRVLSQTVAMLPRSVYVREDRGRRKIFRHPVSRLINNPNPWMRPMAFWQVMLGWAAGNGYGRALIVRDPATAAATELWPIEPWRIEKRVQDGELWYFWQRAEGDTVVLAPSEVFDLYGFGGDGLCGYSLIAAGAKALGHGLARQDYANSYFENGIWGSGVIEVPAPLSDKAYTRMKQSLKEEWTGPENAFRPLLFEEGAQWKTLRVPNKDAQLIESGQFTVLEICRLAGVPPQKVFALERMIYNNIEHMQIEWIMDGVLPWTTRIEQEAQAKLIPGGVNSALYVRHNVDALQRGDFASRMSGHQTAIFGGMRTPNEARALEEVAPVGPEGDALYMQGANKALRDIFEPPEPPAPVAPPAAPEPDDSAATTSTAHQVEVVVDAAATPTWRELAETQRPAFDSAARHVVRRELKTIEKVREKHADDRTALIRWANGWYSLQRGHVESAFEAPLSCLGRIAATMIPAVSIDVDLSPVLGRWQREGIERATSDGDVDEAELAAELALRVYDLAVEAGEAIDA